MFNKSRVALSDPYAMSSSMSQERDLDMKNNFNVDGKCGKKKTKKTSEPNTKTSHSVNLH